MSLPLKLALFLLFSFISIFTEFDLISKALYLFWLSFIFSLEDEFSVSK